MSVSIYRLDRRFRPWVQYLLDSAKAAGYSPRVTSGYRSMREQELLYARYKAGLHPLPVAPPGGSRHNYGLAVDIVNSATRGMSKEEMYEANLPLGRFWESLGAKWGGRKDPVHFTY